VACLAPEPLFSLRNRCLWDVWGKDGACGFREEDEVEVGHKHNQHGQKRETKADSSETTATCGCDPVQQPVIGTKTHTITLKNIIQIMLIHIEYLGLKI